MQLSRPGGSLSDSTVPPLLNEIPGERTPLHAGMIGRYAHYPGSVGFHQAARRYL